MVFIWHLVCLTGINLTGIREKHGVKVTIDSNFKQVIINVVNNVKVGIDGVFSVGVDNQKLGLTI